MHVLKPLRFFLPFLLVCIVLQDIAGQSTTNLKNAEDSLKLILRRLGAAVGDSEKMACNDKFRLLLEETLHQEHTFSYPFDSLTKLGKLTSPDKKFRLYQWNLRMADGRYIFYGFIQQAEAQNSKSLTPLTDFSDSIADPELRILGSGNWFGALYYKIIPVESEGKKTIYTLLGWDGNNSSVTQKVIEILSFSDEGDIIFGAPVFKDYKNGLNTRVIFRYSAESSMILKLDDQQVTSSKKWNPEKRKFITETHRASVIICDRLIPLDPQLEGLYQHYIPASDVYDCFLFNKGKWLFIKEVDARNKH